MVAGASNVERRAELTVDSPEGQRSIRLQSGSTYLGRGEDCQIRISDDILEARHLELDWDGTELWLIYLGKGVRPVVNGQLTAEHQLASGDVFEIGDAKIRVKILRRNVPGGAAAGPGEVRAEVPAELAPAPQEEIPAAPPRELPPEERIRLEYTVHQLMQQRRKGMTIIAALLAFFGLLWFFIIPGNTFMMAISLLIILGSVSAFLFPVHYKLTDAGVEIRGVLIRDSKKWTRFERYVVYPDAVQLLVSQRSLRGRVVKGTLVYFRDNRDEVLAVVREKLGDKGTIAKPKGKSTAPRS